MNSMDMAQGSNVAHPFTPFCHEFSGKWRCFYIYVRPGKETVMGRCVILPSGVLC